MTKDKKIDFSDIIPVVLMGFLFIVIQGLALLIAGPFEAAGIKAFENPDDPMNLIYIFIILLAVTAVILLISKFWKKQLIQVIILFAIGYTSIYVFYPLLAIVIPDFISIILSITVAALLVFTLYKYPEWYIIDICGIIIGAGAIAIFGASLGVLLVIILLIGLAIYDAISVYKTKHMIDLADTVMDLKLPVLLVIPKIRHYSLIRETKSLKQKLKEGEERDAFFMGLGDVVMPGILVAASFHFIDEGLPIAFGVMIGTLAGFAILMTFVMKGKPQAGLPFLGGGAILGYLVSSYLKFGYLAGLSLPI
jgi:presenilin-like A22 family membrane protease